MPLTPAQLVTLKNAINAETDPALVAYRTTNDDSGMAAWYNTPTVPVFYVWRSRVSEQDITSLKSAENTTWSWTAFIARTPQEQTGWARMFNGTYIINPALSQVRDAFVDIFSGGTGAAQRTHLTAMSKRTATRCEKLFADTTDGVGTLAAPAVMQYEGNVSPQNISDALRS